MTELDGPSRAPASGGPARSLVVLLHGLGADGNDLISLAGSWTRLLPDTVFIAPNAPQPCDRAPMGYQWFSLASFEPKDMFAGARDAAPDIDGFLDRQMAQYGLGPEKVALVGFSQGTMMALHVGLRRDPALACIVGFSGALVGAEVLGEEIKARPPVMLIHGGADEIVPVAALHQAMAALSAAKVATEWHVSPNLGHGIDPDGVALAGDFLKACLN